MASVRAHSDEDRIDQSPESASDSVQSQLTIHSAPYTGLPTHMYPFSSGFVSTAQPPMRSKRRQVKNACTNCQKACKKCDDARPCLRCVKYGIGEECVDSQRKERKKGIKRGPYKKRDGKSELFLVPPPGGTPPAASFMSPMGYPLPIYGPMVHKPGEAAPYHPTYYVPMQPAPPSHPGQDHEGQAYPLPPPHQYYPPYIPYGTMPYPTPYLVPHHRPDMPVVMQPHPQYPGYPNGHHAPYSKPPSAGNPGVDVTVNGNARREEHADGREPIAGSM
ncbi:hypothetical protein BC827DRAFT_1368131 [Russula dissimulans]|nr:hypothetical protein BC827DRAFT_1368131 [Russula dissimulans]